MQLILVGLTAANILFTWQVDFKEKQLWEHKTILHSSSIHVGGFIIFFCMSRFTCSKLYTYIWFSRASACLQNCEK